MLERRLAALLASRPTMTLATGGVISPSVVAASFAEDGPFALRLLMDLGDETLAKLLARPEVTLVIGDGNALGLLARAEGRPVLAVRKAEQGPRRVSLRIEVTRWLLTDVSMGWVPARELRRTAALGAHASSRPANRSAPLERR